MEDQVVPPGSDRNTGPEQKAIFGLFLSIAIILVSLRFYVRARIVKKLWWDDFFLFLGIIFSIAGFGLTVAKINSGFGRHIYYLLPKQIKSAVKLEFIELPVFISSNAWTKISVCLFLLRIFVSNRKWKRAMYIIIALIVATNVSSITLILSQCKPIAAKWDHAIKGTCWSEETEGTILYYQGVVSIISDFLLAFLPTYFLKDIQISFRIKISICVLMSLGVFTGICAINRTVLLSEFRSDDFTYSSKQLYIWTGLELNIATIATTIPALRPLWAKGANQNQKNRAWTRRSNDEHRQNTTYVMMGQQIEADSLPTRLETCITAQGGNDQEDVGSEVRPSPDCTGIIKTSDISVENFRKLEGKWIPEHSDLSDRERGVEEMV